MNKNGDYDVNICNKFLLDMIKNIYFFDCCFKILYM